MAWTTPMTATAGAFNAADFNTYVRDNLNETMPGKATTSGDWFVASAANALAERKISQDIIAPEQTTTSTSYTDLATTGPTVTVTTGTTAIVMLTTRTENSTSNAISAMSYAVSGATTIAAADEWCVMTDGIVLANWERRSVAHRVTLTAGSNTFTAKYRVGSGTGTFADRTLTVWSF